MHIRRAVAHWTPARAVDLGYFGSPRHGEPGRETGTDNRYDILQQQAIRLVVVGGRFVLPIGRAFCRWCEDGGQGDCGRRGAGAAAGCTSG